MRGADPNCRVCSGTGMVSPLEGSGLDGAPDWMAVPCECIERMKPDMKADEKPAQDWLTWLVRGVSCGCVVAAVVVFLSILLFLAESNGWCEGGF